MLLLLISGLFLSSCGTPKSVKDLMNSYEYGIKKVHIENKNSTYDDLTANYLESLKSDDQRSAEAFAKDTLLYMRKGPCLGHCPVYSIVLYNNGKVVYDGLNFVELKGIFESKISAEQRMKINELINQVEFVKMSSRYPGTVENVSDVARTNLLVSDEGVKFSTIISYGEPQPLKDIQKYLEVLVEELSWVQI